MITPKENQQPDYETVTFYGPPNNIQDTIAQMVNNPNPSQVASVKYFLVLVGMVVDALNRGMSVIQQAGPLMVNAEKTNHKPKFESSSLITTTVEQPGQIDFYKTTSQLKFKECDEEGSAESCARTICMTVAATFTPLNKQRPDETSLNSADMEEMSKINSAAGEEYKIKYSELLGRARKYGITEESPPFQDLNKRLFLLCNINTPNCAGMSARTITMWSHQPAIRKANATLLQHNARYMNRKTSFHSTARLTIPGNKKTPDKKLICDSYDLSTPERSGKPMLCDSKEVALGKGWCMHYQDRLWSAPEKNTFEISSSPRFHLSKEQQKFYNNERKQQQAEYFRKLEEKVRAPSLTR